MSDEQVGKYIKLLCAQHQTGHLSEKDMLQICGSYDAKIWSKFTKDSEGLFFNERCEIEIIKRNKYCDSRRVNRSKSDIKVEKNTNNISKSYVKHMENENVIINNILDKTSAKKEIPDLDTFMAHGAELCKKANMDIDQYKFSIEQKYASWVDAGWKDGHGKAIKNWKSKLGNTLPHLRPTKPAEKKITIVNSTAF